MADAFQAEVAAQRAAWEARPFVRALYHEWFDLIAERLAPGEGPTIELGAGSGGLSERYPAVRATDIAPTPWAHEAADAQALPYDDASVRNLVMVDVLHHLPRPVRFLAEAERVLSPGGRVVMLEPYCSPLSTVAYRRLHHEALDMDVLALADTPHSGDDPFDANIALPTLLFWRDRVAYARTFEYLRIVERRRLSWLAYPLSGGFSRKPLAYGRLARLLQRTDRALAPVLAPLAGFRCLVVLERQT